MDTLRQFLQIFHSRLHFFNTFNYKNNENNENNNNNQTTDHTIKTERIVKSDPQLLKTVKTRFNYAGSACSARVISSNPHSQSPASILVANKDSYLRNLCTNVDKFVVVELCQEVKVDTVVLGNYELFSSTFRRFRVHGAKSLDQTNTMTTTTTTLTTWKLLLSAEMQNGPLLHSDQAFPVASKDFIKFLRIDFDDQHGNEHWCPVSSLKVYGKTMIDEFNDDVKKQVSLSKGLLIENEIIKSQSNHHHHHLAIYSITPELEIIYKQMSRLRFKITQTQLKVSFFHSLIKLTTQCPIEEESLSLLKDRYTALESKSFVLKSALLSRTEPETETTDGNVFKILHDRLNKLEASLQQSPINFLNSFLLRSRQNVPQITTTTTTTASSSSNSSYKSAESSIEELFSTLTNDIYKLKSDHHLLQSNLSTQKSYIFILIILNSIILAIFTGYILKSLIKTKTKSSKSNNATTTNLSRYSSDFKRLPLTELKSPHGSISQLTSCSQSPLQSPVSLSPSSSSLGLILSDDEVLLSEPKLQKY